MVAQPRFKVNPIKKSIELISLEEPIFYVKNFSSSFFINRIFFCIWLFRKHIANGISDDIYIREKPPKLGKSSCRKLIRIMNSIGFVDCSCLIHSWHGYDYVILLLYIVRWPISTFHHLALVTMLSYQRLYAIFHNASAIEISLTFLSSMICLGRCQKEGSIV